MRTGDKVVYIEKNLPEIGLIKGQVYEVLDVQECNCEDGPHIDVGITMDGPFSYCQHCGAITDISERWFFSHTGFRPVEEITIEEKEEAYSKTLK